MPIIRFELGVEDLARIRFAISPMWELVGGLRIIRDPARAAPHLPWVREAIPIARELDLEVAFALMPTDGYIPDFLTPPPAGPFASFADELEAVAETRTPQIRDEVERMVRNHGGRRSAVVERVLAQPRREIRRMTKGIGKFWELAVAPHWPRIGALLEADIAYRSRRLTEGGSSALFSDLHEGVTWVDGGLEVQSNIDLVEHPEGQGLLLVPSTMHWHRPALIVGEPWQPSVLYPARGVALLWEPEDQDAAEGLAGVIGDTRAAMLAALDAPRSTTDLARRLGVTPGAVSQHLSRLAAAGLVVGRRDGRSVLYMRTPVAERWLDA